jgi:hypothetical protein
MFTEGRRIVSALAPRFLLEAEAARVVCLTCSAIFVGGGGGAGGGGGGGILGALPMICYILFELVWVENIFVLNLVLIPKEIYNRPLTVVIVQVRDRIGSLKVSHRKRFFKRFHKLD